jgi:hypothetical protein
MTLTAHEINDSWLAAWEEALRQCGKGLDLSNPDDRAIFRMRVAARTYATKVTTIASVACERGATLPGNATRDAATRALADSWIIK